MKFFKKYYSSDDLFVDIIINIGVFIFAHIASYFILPAFEITFHFPIWTIVTYCVVGAMWDFVKFFHWNYRLVNRSVSDIREEINK